LTGARLGSFAPDHSLPFRLLEWAISLPSLSLVVGGLSFWPDSALVWDAALLAQVTTTSGGLAWWCYWPWLAADGFGAPLPLRVDLAALRLGFLDAPLRRLRLERWLGSGDPGGAYLHGLPGWARLLRCGVLTGLSLAAFAWLVALLSNFLLYSEVLSMFVRLLCVSVCVLCDQKARLCPSLFLFPTKGACLS
jgi:hypothetical protein